MVNFRTYIESIEYNASDIKNNAHEDFELLMKVDKYVDEILEECTFCALVPHSPRKNANKDFVKALMVDYSAIFKYIEEMRKSQTGIFIEMRNIEALYPEVEQHIRDGYLEFDEYEDMVE